MSKKIPLKQITRDPALQMREGTDPAVVEEYAEAMRGGAKFAPIRLYDVLGSLLLVDGWHRVAGGEVAGVKSLPAEVIPGSRREAVLAAVAANPHHGLRRSNATKRKAVMTLLEDPEWSQWSNVAIAEKTGTSESLVRNLRSLVLNEAAQANHEGESGSGSSNWPGGRRGLDGKTYSLPTRQAPAARQVDLTEAVASRSTPEPGAPAGERHDLTGLRKDLAQLAELQPVIDVDGELRLVAGLLQPGRLEELQGDDLFNLIDVVQAAVQREREKADQARAAATVAPAGGLDSVRSLARELKALQEAQGTWNGRNQAVQFSAYTLEDLAEKKGAMPMAPEEWTATMRQLRVRLRFAKIGHAFPPRRFPAALEEKRRFVQVLARLLHLNMRSAAIPEKDAPLWVYEEGDLNMTFLDNWNEDRVAALDAKGLSSLCAELTRLESVLEAALDAGRPGQRPAIKPVSREALAELASAVEDLIDLVPIRLGIKDEGVPYLWVPGRDRTTQIGHVAVKGNMQFWSGEQVLAVLAGLDEWVKFLAEIPAEDSKGAADETEADVPEADQPEAQADVPEADQPEAQADVPEADQPEADVPEADVPEAETKADEAPEHVDPHAELRAQLRTRLHRCLKLEVTVEASGRRVTTDGWLMELHRMDGDQLLALSAGVDLAVAEERIARDKLVARLRALVGEGEFIYLMNGDRVRLSPDLATTWPYPWLYKLEYQLTAIEKEAADRRAAEAEAARIAQENAASLAPVAVLHTTDTTSRLLAILRNAMRKRAPWLVALRAAWPEGYGQLAAWEEEGFPGAPEDEEDARGNWQRSRPNWRDWQDWTGYAEAEISAKLWKLGDAELSALHRKAHGRHPGPRDRKASLIAGLVKHILANRDPYGLRPEDREAVNAAQDWARAS